MWLNSKDAYQRGSRMCEQAGSVVGRFQVLHVSQICSHLVLGGVVICIYDDNDDNMTKIGRSRWLRGACGLKTMMTTVFHVLLRNDQKTSSQTCVCSLFAQLMHVISFFLPEMEFTFDHDVFSPSLTSGKIKSPSDSLNLLVGPKSKTSPWGLTLMRNDGSGNVDPTGTARHQIN